MNRRKPNTDKFTREKLSPRLRLLLEQGLDGADFWDVCCDHGYLGEQALASGRFGKVHFVDRVPHIMDSLKFRMEGHTEGREAVFITAPAEDLDEPLSGTVVVAGVGGYTLIKILERWEEKKILRARRLILNPLTHIKELRQFLEVWPAYREVDSLIVQERHKQREVLILHPV